MLDAGSDVSLCSASLVNKLGLKLRKSSETVQTSNVVTAHNKRVCTLPVMESRDMVSVSRLASRPIFASLGLEG